MAGSDDPDEHLLRTPQPDQIPLAELYVGCPQGQVVLYWPAGGQWVIPRLASAHNRLWGDEVYQFLLDVQETWGQASAYWSWGHYESLHALPRVQIGPLLVAPARWRVGPDDKHTPLSALHTELGLPRRVVLVEGDNRLLLDLESYPGQLLFEEARSKLTGPKPGQSQALFNPGVYLHLEEWLRPAAGSYVQETLYSLPRQDGFLERIAEKLPSLPLSESRLCPAADRLRVPGQDWYYAKLYGSVLRAEAVLVEMQQSIEQVMNAGEKTPDRQPDWFFIRYKDPDAHIRFRWRANSPADTSTGIVPSTNNAVTPTGLSSLWEALLRQGDLSRVELATYCPEWERYGRQAYPRIESLFCRDSAFVLGQIRQSDDLAALNPAETTEETRLLTGIRNAYYLVRAGGLLEAEPRTFWEQGQQMYLAEQPDTKAARTWLNECYRAQALAVSARIQQPLSAEEQTHYQQMQAALGELRLHYDSGHDAPVTYRSVVRSLVHMHLNRWFAVQPRRFELVVYHFLTRWSLIPDKHKQNSNPVS